jgi:hypothetical protein
MLLAVSFLAACADDDEDDPTTDDTPTTEMTPTPADPAVGTTPEPAAEMTPTPVAQVPSPEPDATPDVDVPAVAATPVAGMVVDQVLDDPALFVGQQVAVASHVNEIVDTNAFTLSGRDDGDLLVFIPAGMLADGMTEGTLTHAFGTVQFFDQDDPQFAGLGTTNGTQDLTQWQDQPVLVADEVELLLPAAGVVINNIHDDPEMFYGQQVAVLGQVQELVGEQGQAFAIGANRADSDILILVDTMGPTGQTGQMGQVNMAEIQEDAWVWLSGVVHEFTRDEDGQQDQTGTTGQLGAQFDALFDDDDFAEYEGQPVIVLQELMVLAPAPTHEVNDIINDTDEYIGQQVTVTGRIVDVINQHAFVLEGDDGLLGLGLIGDQDLLIVAEQEIDPRLLHENVIVQVSGMVEEFHADDTTRFPNLGVEDGAFGDFDGQAVIVAETIQAIAVD